jgi:hypothetical protein
MIKITDFEKPKVHPFGLLEGYENASEKESVLEFMLTKAIERKTFSPIATSYDHPDMVECGLLVQTGFKEYALTKKSIGLLYSVYGK